MKDLCDTCTHDKPVSGCELYCYGVLGWDEENEVVTSCEDYKRRQKRKGESECTET